MKLIHTRKVLVTLALTSAIAGALAGPAVADEGRTPLARPSAGGYSCSVLMGTHWPASGKATWTWVGRNTVNPVTLKVTDARADGHAVGVRLVTVRRNDSTRYWPWNVNHSGSGKTVEIGTHATDAGGIKAVRIEVAVLEGGSPLSSCHTPYTKNPYS